LASIPAIGVAALVGAGCSSGPSGTVIEPRGGFANDKAEPDTVHWFKVHSAVISGLGNVPTIPSGTQVNYSGLSAACVAFGDAVGAAKRLPAIPDSGAQTLWLDSLAQFQAGVTNCSNGVLHQSSTLLGAASSDFTLGHTTLATLIFGPAKNGA
jgi:hypothetical protein